jgi:hypothetical protein
MPSVDPCSPVLETLFSLLAEAPAGHDRSAAERAAERLDRLEYAARWDGASAETLAAIAGARLLLGLAAYPVPRHPRVAPRPAGGALAH